MGIKIIATNKKAYHDYFIDETFEAGIALTGTEVKSIREGKVNLKESFCRIKNGEVFVPYGSADYKGHRTGYTFGTKWPGPPLGKGGNCMRGSAIGGASLTPSSTSSRSHTGPSTRSAEPAGSWLSSTWKPSRPGARSCSHGCGTG